MRVDLLQGAPDMLVLKAMSWGPLHGSATGAETAVLEMLLLEL
jgi:hypothetical protein